MAIRLHNRDTVVSFNINKFFWLVCFHLLILRSISAQAVVAGEQHTETFIHYFDCVRTPDTPKVDLQIFMKVQGSNKTSYKKASDYGRGVDIDLVETKSGSLTGMQVGGPANRLSIEELKRGIQLGVLGTTVHTFELDKNFDPEKGGHITMGFLTSISFAKVLRDFFIPGMNPVERDRELLKAQKDFPNLGLSEKLSHHYNVKKSLWSQEVFNLSRENGKWVLTNSKGEKVDTVFAEMKTFSPGIPFVLGLSKVQSAMTHQDTSCPLLPPERMGSNAQENPDLNFLFRFRKKSEAVDCYRN